MICFVALIVFAVLGIFSAKYRAYFFEASDCIFRRVTLRKCTTSFDKKMKVKVTAGFTKLNKPFGGFVFKHFEFFSWIITILMVVSLVWSGYSGGVAIYNWVSFGNCNGPNSTQVCSLNQIASQGNNFWDIVVPTDVNAKCLASSIK
ncbi:MAG: hypothetical protein NTY48_02705 [Candidatus Diapherotrites archaeon]|nr:hypothetical protein [Candidatus Diapherotrites archaeon]